MRMEIARTEARSLYSSDALLAVHSVPPVTSHLNPSMNRNPFIATLAVVTALVSPAFALVAGDTVTPDALGKATFIQGPAPTAWEPGKIYFLECWATWCGPCVGAIPHVNGLHKKYADKGLKVIGLDVWDDGPTDRIETFVKAKGNGMSYPVAFVGNGGAFEKQWLKPAGVTGIPHTFIVRDGKLLFSTNPHRVTDAMIEKLLAGGKEADEVITTMTAAQADHDKLIKVLDELQAAEKSKDAATMAAKLVDLEKCPKGHTYLLLMKLRLAQLRQDWDGMESTIQNSPNGFSAATQMDRFYSDLEDSKIPVIVRQTLANRLEKAMGNSPEPLQSLGLLKLLVGLGEKGRATALVGKMNTSRFITKNTLDRLRNAVEKGEIPTRQEFTHGWIEIEAKPSKPVAQ